MVPCGKLDAGRLAPRALMAGTELLAFQHAGDAVSIGIVEDRDSPVCHGVSACVRMCQAMPRRLARPLPATPGIGDCSPLRAAGGDPADLLQRT
jgi:hypothetical protein